MNCVLASMWVSLVGTDASRQPFATESHVVVIIVPLADRQRKTCAHPHIWWSTDMS